MLRHIYKNKKQTHLQGNSITFQTNFLLNICLNICPLLNCLEAPSAFPKWQRKRRPLGEQYSDKVYRKTRIVLKIVDRPGFESWPQIVSCWLKIEIMSFRPQMGQMWPNVAPPVTCVRHTDILTAADGLTS